jgi:hypothetical protein
MCGQIVSFPLYIFQLSGAFNRKDITMKKVLIFLGLATCILGAAGCAAVLIGGAAAVTGTGTYFYINGELTTDYYAPFDKVWSACEKTVADMRGINVVWKKGIADGNITTMIDDQEVQFKMVYKAKNVITVSVRVGLVGDVLASRLLHDKIAGNLPK